VIAVGRGFAEAERPVLAGFLWDAFEAKFRRVLRDREAAAAVLGSGLRPQGVLTARRDGVAVGVALLKDRTGLTPVRASLRSFVSAYGPVSGTLRAGLLGVLDEAIPPGVLAIDAVAVASAARGNGVGTLLLALAEKVARTRGHGTLMLEVVTDNTGARRLYERLGFSVVSTTRAGPVVRRAFGITGYHRMHKAV